MNPDDIRPQHWQRLAYVYIRQSSLHQVLHHRESRRRQQVFKQRAQELGWPAARIRVVDEDLAQSGARHQRGTVKLTNLSAYSAPSPLSKLLILHPSVDRFRLQNSRFLLNLTIPQRRQTIEGGCVRSGREEEPEVSHRSHRTSAQL